MWKCYFIKKIHHAHCLGAKMTSFDLADPTFELRSSYRMRYISCEPVDDDREGLHSMFDGIFCVMAQM